MNSLPLQWPQQGWRPLVYLPLQLLQGWTLPHDNKRWWECFHIICWCHLHLLQPETHLLSMNGYSDGATACREWFHLYMSCGRFSIPGVWCACFSHCSYTVMLHDLHLHSFRLAPQCHTFVYYAVDNTCSMLCNCACSRSGTIRPPLQIKHMLTAHLVSLASCPARSTFGKSVR